MHTYAMNTYCAGLFWIFLLCPFFFFLKLFHFLKIKFLQDIGKFHTFLYLDMTDCEIGQPYLHFANRHNETQREQSSSHRSTLEWNKEA